MNICGGTITAYSINGAAIGAGGSTGTGVAGSATVTISGGAVNASTTGTGVAIGGGSSPTGTGGGANVSISGGTIVTSSIGGGYGAGGYAAAAITITGGSLNGTVTSTPTNGSDTVYLTRVSLYDSTLSPAAFEANASVTSLSVTDASYAEYTYGMNAVKTDGDGRLYLFLPQNASTHTAQASSKTFTGNVASGGTGVLTCGATVFHSVHATQSDRYALYLDGGCTAAFSGSALVADGEDFTFYLKYSDVTGYVPTAVAAYESDANETMTYLSAQPAATATAGVYSYTFTAVTRDMELWFSTAQGGANRLELDLSANDVMIRANASTPANFDVMCGAYTLTNFNGSFYLTTNGINSSYNLTVLSGSPSIYFDKLNLTPVGSGVYIRGGEATITYSAYDNKISSTGAAAIAVSADATLNLRSTAANHSLTLALGSSFPAIGGAGTVNITRTAGFLNLLISGSTQIAAEHYSYTVSSQTAGTPPYTYQPRLGTLYGYSQGRTHLYPLSSLPAVSTQTSFTACSVSYVGFGAPLPTHAANGSGELVISGLSVQPTVTRDNTSVTGTYDAGADTLTLAAADSWCNITVTASGTQTVTGIQVTAQPTTLTYSHGNTLDLTGLAVTLTYSNSSTAVIGYADFAANGIFVSPQQGQVLYTEANHAKTIAVTCAGYSDHTDPLTVMPAVTLVGNPTVGYTLQVSALGQGGSSMTWVYQVFDAGTNTWTNISGFDNSALAPSTALIGKSVRALVTFTSTYVGNVNSNEVTILAPQLSVTVPTTMTVTVSGSGSMAVSAGSIQNSSVVPVYLTNVSYAWLTDGASDADELFNSYAAVTPTLTLGNDTHDFTGNNMSWSVNRTINAMSGTTPQELTLGWSFALGAGNYIKLAIAADESVQVATITYTVGYEPPTP